jgi:hypothetical protein
MSLRELPRHELRRAPPTADEKEIKVWLPAGHHLKLHRLKVLQGQNLSDTVRMALDLYFAQVDRQRQTEHARRALAALAGPGEPGDQFERP